MPEFNTIIENGEECQSILFKPRKSNAKPHSVIVRPDDRFVTRADDVYELFTVDGRTMMYEYFADTHFSPIVTVALDCAEETPTENRLLYIDRSGDYYKECEYSKVAQSIAIAYKHAAAELRLFESKIPLMEQAMKLDREKKVREKQ